jgi:diaminopimelate decarboxylase
VFQKNKNMKSNLSQKNIEKSFRSALSKGLVREEDTAVIFHDLSFLEERIKKLQSLFPPQTLHAIAIKANPLTKILEFIKPLDVGLEAATSGEVHLALKTGIEPGKIVYDSPVKTRSEIEFALKAGIHLNIDNLSEMERVNNLLKTIPSKSTIGIRINPQVGIGSIAGSSVAGEYSKFGVPIKYKRDELTDAFMKHPWLTGVHLHVGSQGCPMELLINGIGILFDFVNEINVKRTSTGFPPVAYFDIGGGMPVSYQSNLVPVSMEQYSAAIREKYPLLFTSQYSLLTEFGRWVHVNAGWVASRVEYVKRDPAINTAMIHAGADLFLRECLNPKDWQHEFSVLDRNGNLKEGKDDHPYHLAGPLCFSGDILAKNIELPRIEEGDYLVIHDTGGYTFSMWSRYNSRQTPRILGYVNDGEKIEVLKERETFEDIYDFWT